jgi:hypothetical protein
MHTTESTSQYQTWILNKTLHDEAKRIWDMNLKINQMQHAKKLFNEMIIPLS